ncbi:hypothetical protein BH18ACT15_BH18ACT15_13610 [soil metagenome]
MKEGPLLGACYGYGIRSHLDIPFLRGGTGAPISVSAAASGDEPRLKPLLDWRPRPGHGFSARMYELDGIYEYWVDGLGRYTIDPAGGRLTVPGEGDTVSRAARALGVPLALCLTSAGGVALHAAAVEVNGRALVLTAPGRFGKTTLAGAFVAAGHRLLAEDIACCRVSDGPEILPGPRLLRLRPDVYEHFELPAATVLRSDDDRVYLSVDDGSRTGAPVPLGAVCILNRGEEDVTITPYDAATALRNLWVVSFNLPTDKDRSRALWALSDIVARVPLWEVRRPWSLESLSGLVDSICEECAG